MRSALTRFRAGLSSKRSWNRKSKRCWDSRRTDHGYRDAATTSHEKRLSNRSGSALVPRLRRLRDPLGGAVRISGAGHQARKLRHRFRDRLLQPLSVLHEYLWFPYDPPPRPGSGHGHQCDSPGGGSLGGYRRRRFAFDRRESYDSYAAAQRRHQGAAIQQQDLRFNETPVLSHLRVQQEDEINAVRVSGPAFQPDVTGDRFR